MEDGAHDKVCVRACVRAENGTHAEGRAARRTSHLYQLLELLVDQVLEAMDPHLVRVTQVGSAPQSAGGNEGVGLGLGVGQG